MLPLYKRCRRCRRWAAYGPAGTPGVKRHCKAHALRSEVPVHRRMCEAANCTKRPSFAAVGEWRPLRCSAHKATTDMDVCHSRCHFRHVQNGVSTRCWRTPTFGHRRGANVRGGGVPQMCWEHKAPDMQQVFYGKCRHKGCSDVALYARPTERKLSYCATHCRDGDVNLAEAPPPAAGGGADMTLGRPQCSSGTSSPLPNITLTTSRRHRLLLVHARGQILRNNQQQG
jgi:hypothetical protein